MVMAATIAQTLNARRSETDLRRDLRFAAYSHDNFYANDAKFGKPALDSFGVMSYDEVTHFDRILYNNFKVSSWIHPRRRNTPLIE